MKVLTRYSLSGAIALCLTVVSTTAVAQLEEIVVTAQKRAESVNDVPISISAFDQAALNNANIQDVTALVNYSPGVTGYTSGVASTTWRIRGIGTNDWNVSSEPAVAVFMDDAYIGRNTIASTAFFDLERVEVLKGPQGTLFGRNASAGAINVITRKPEDKNSLDLGIGFGNEGQQRYTLTGNVAASDRAAFRFAYQGSELEGIQTNVNNGEELFRDDESYRLTGQFAPNDAVEITASVHRTEYETNLSRQHNSGLSGLIGLPGGGSPVSDVSSSDSLNFEDVEATGVNLRVVWDASDTLTLTSITDWRDWEYQYNVDVDGIGIFFPVDFEPALPGAIVANGPADFDQTPQFGDNIGQEFRLNGGTDKVRWFVGASWFQEDVAQTSDFVWPIDLDLDLLLGPGSGGVVTVQTENDPASYQISGDYTSIGVYGDVAWDVTDRVTLTAGVRWSEDDKDFCSLNVDPTLIGIQILGPDTGGQTICGNQSWSEVTPRAVIDFALNDNAMIYASYAKGYKGGGFNTAVAGTGPFGDQPPFALQPFDPETSDAYEIGLKATLADGQFQLNAALFDTDYKDLQLLLADLSVVIINLDGVDVSGGEVEFDFAPAALEGLNLSGYYTFTDSEIRAPGSVANGSDAPTTPDTTWGLMAQYEHNVGDAGSLRWFLAYNWQDSQIHDITVSRFKQDSYGLLDAALTFTHKSGRWSAFVSGQNLTDEDYVVFAIDSLGFGAAINRGFPAMYMAGVNVYLGDVD